MVIMVGLGSRLRGSAEDFILRCESGELLLQTLVISLQRLRSLFETRDFFFEFSDMTLLSFAECSLTVVTVIKKSVI